MGLSAGAQKIRQKYPWMDVIAAQNRKQKQEALLASPLLLMNNLVCNICNCIEWRADHKANKLRCNHCGCLSCYGIEYSYRKDHHDIEAGSCCHCGSNDWDPELVLVGGWLCNICGLHG